ncbi:hypothetical protein IAR55_005846 [Kwoniella newhampshirensis]|uniref:MATH domain-containing protein n=1 Tax=Kwoniella newhampshirensis TaxID=1651941 RepID=A0AAW0YVJ7_9TREE
MTSVPPPYSSRDHAQVQPVPPASTIAATSPAQEFAETTSVCLEWRLTGLKAMYESTRGDQKSKCIKSAVFGDADNLWEVLWYPNAGTSNQTAGDHVSLYLSCVPTAQERDSSITNQWARKGLWWFKFEIRPISLDPRTPKKDPIASKDASDHTFAVKTANWGWQAFAKRDALFQHPAVLDSDGFMIICTIQAQPQPPAGLWLGVGLQAGQGWVQVSSRGGVGSGGGLSAWASSDGSAGGVAGGTSAAGGVKRVVPKDLVMSVGAMLDDPLYSDVEFIIPSKKGSGSAPRRIYGNKKLLNRCEYFDAMFHGGFREVEGVIEEEDSEDELDVLSDSDMEDESYVRPVQRPYSPDLHLTTTTSRTSSSPPGRLSTSADPPAHTHDRAHVPEEESTPSEAEEAHSKDGEGVADITLEEEGIKEVVAQKRSLKSPSSQAELGASTSSAIELGLSMGPRKTRVMVRDAAWSTWWAVLYWIYTDIIFFAPLSSSFQHNPKNRTSTTTGAQSDHPKTRMDWIHRWMAEHHIEDPPALSSISAASISEYEATVGPRPVSAKAIYRLADKLDLPALKLRAFQYICSQLTSQNVPAEVFSRFSSTYEDVRRVQVAFFLKHWGEIKKSDTMMQIWQQIRHGKHVGFEEVWPLIVGQLDFKPS